MADISKLKLPNGSEYDLKVYTDHVAPMMSKTFTGVIGTAANWNDATLFFGKIIPDDFNGLWKISYIVRAEAAGSIQAKGYYKVTTSGTGDAMISYTVWNLQKNTGYRPIYSQVLYRAKQAGITNGYGHLLGWRLYSSWNAITAANSRTITVDVVECVGCTFNFLDEAVKYANVPGTGSTNYNTYSELDATTNGVTTTGDRNDSNYQNRIYYSNPCLKSYAAGGRYTLTFTKNGNYLLPITADDNKYSGQEREYTSETFDPFGEIYYRNSSGAIKANDVIGNATLYRQMLFDARYSFTGVTNSASTSVMTAGKPVYIVCVPQSDGQVKLYSNPLSFTAPTTNDGLLYILLGYSYNTYQIELLMHHPVYVYKNGALRELSNYSYYSGDAGTVNGYTVNANVPSGAKFTDTTYSVATTSSNGLMSSTDKTKLNNISGTYDASTETISFVFS